MSNYLLSLATSLVAFAWMSLAFLGWGRLVARIVRLGFLRVEQVFAYIWLGWVASLLFFQIWNLVQPITAISSLVFLTIGAIFAVKPLGRHLRDVQTSFDLGDLLFVGFLLVFVIWIASRSMIVPANYDSGQYHFNSIRWLNEYPIVMGLGNLHGRLAFNQSFFTYVAFLNVYPLFNHGYNLANGYLVLLICVELQYVLYKLIRTRSLKGEIKPLSGFIMVAFLPILLRFASVEGLSSPTPDIASFVLQVVIFVNVVKLLEPGRYSRDKRFRAVLIAILCSGAITLKLSNAAYAMLTGLTTLGIWLFQLYLAHRVKLSSITGLVWPGVVMLGVWVLRGVLLSGCPAYPSTFMCLKVDWAVPLEKVNAEALITYSWARVHDVNWYGNPYSYLATLQSNAWFSGWLDRMLHTAMVKYTLILASIGVLASAISLVGLSFKRRKELGTYFLLLIPPGGALVFWYIVAPDPRFAHALFWIFCISAATPFLVRVVLRLYVHRLVIFMGVLLVSLGLVIVIRPVSTSPQLLKSISLQGYQDIPVATLKTEVTNSGLEIYTPADGLRKQCWDAPLPCTPFERFDPNLTLRGSGLASGFIVAANK